MPGSGPRQYPCILCNKRTKPCERRPVNKDLSKLLRKYFLIDNAEGVICNKCRHKCYKIKDQTGARTVPVTPNLSHQTARQDRSNAVSSPPSVCLPIQTTAKSHAYCIICKKPGPKLIVISADVRFKVFMVYNILIPKGSRCCPCHVMNGTIEDVTKTQSLFDQTTVNKTTIMELIQQLREEANVKGEKRLDFDSPQGLSDDEYKTLTGLAREEFDDLMTYIADINNSRSRSIRTCVAVFLTKMKSGIDNSLLGAMFNMTKEQVNENFLQCNIEVMFVTSWFRLLSNASGYYIITTRKILHMAESQKVYLSQYKNADIIIYV